MNFLRKCGRCRSGSESDIAEIESPVYDKNNIGNKKLEEKVSNPITKTIDNPTGTTETINPGYVENAADIQS